MADWIDITKDPRHVAREKRKAQALRQSPWWRQRLAQGICAYCHGTFAPDALTMDHVVPLARGGRSVKGNVVPCCRACNATKAYWPKPNTHDTSRKVIILRMGWGPVTTRDSPVTKAVALINSIS